MTDETPLARTPLHELHVALGARMVPFAGYDMPVQYPAGILTEHLHTRAQAGLFDVSHMGQAFLEGEDIARRFEALVPGDIAGLAEGAIRYTQFTDANGGILDDLMATRLSDDALFLVVNAGCKRQDFAHIAARLDDCRLVVLEDRALVALQGPKAAEVFARFAPEAAAMAFMTWRRLNVEGVELFVSRSGYTGEDGYEISIPGDKARAFVEKLLAQPEVKPIGLGARDSLRLEAGLCLYGHDIDATTSPIEAGLLWSIGKRRRAEGGFPGAARIQGEIAGAAARKRGGVLPDGKAPAREGTEIADADGRIIGKITSGGFSPSLQRPVAMGYVEAAFAKADTPVTLIVRGKPLPARVAAMPFTPHRYFRG